MNFWAADHYTWVYETVIARGREIGENHAQTEAAAGALISG
jgi:hypothetical protein